MSRLLHAYVALVKVSWARALEYRAQIVLWVLSWVFPLIMMVVWLAIVDQAGPAAGWGRADFISYYVGAAFINQLASTHTLWDWDEDIRLGTLSTKLLKPLDPFHHQLSDELGFKLFLLLILAPVVVLVSLIWREIHYPLSPGRLAAVVASVAGGFTLNVMMATTFAMLAFWSTQVRNLYSLWWGIGQFFSGWIAPLSLFPAPIQQAAYLLPFRSGLGFPVEVLMGRLGWTDIWYGLAVTGAWIVVFTVLYRVLWRRGLRRYDAVGG